MYPDRPGGGTAEVIIFTLESRSERGAGPRRIITLLFILGSSTRTHTRRRSVAGVMDVGEERGWREAGLRNTIAVRGQCGSNT